MQDNNFLHIKSFAIFITKLYSAKTFSIVRVLLLYDVTTPIRLIESSFSKSLILSDKSSAFTVKLYLPSISSLNVKVIILFLLLMPF